MVPILPSVFLACYWIQCVAVVEWAFYRNDGIHKCANNQPRDDFLVGLDNVLDLLLNEVVEGVDVLFNKSFHLQEAIRRTKYILSRV